MSDEALLEALRHDDRQAFKTLMERYLDKIWRLCYRTLNNRQDAEDATQEVFVTVWNNRHQWEAEGAKFSTWVYRVAVNRSIDFARRRKQNHTELDEALPDAAMRTGEEQASAHQMQGVMMECLKQLPEKQMMAILYYYYEDMDIGDICVKLQATEDAVRSLLKRGRASMKEIIRDKLGDEYCPVEGAASNLWR